MNKRIIFFDGDGTVWYPKKTRHREYPSWLYKDQRYKNYTDHLMLTPGALLTLKKLKQKGVITVIISGSPLLVKEAKAQLKQKVNYFGLEKIVDEVCASRNYRESKADFMLKILNKRKIPKSRALMVGDSYKWDYQPTKEIGIDVILIESEYEPMLKETGETIKKLSELFQLLD